MNLIASIPSPASSGFHLGPFEAHVYGLMYVVGLVLAIWITVRRWEAQGGSRELVYDVALWGFPAGLIGGRLYFLVTSWNEVPGHWWGPFAVWEGGLGIWGGIALGSAVGLWRLRRAGVSPAPFMDAAAPALLVGQAVGRIGNYFNQELFGGPTNLPWALQISPSHRPGGYEGFATFHPTFLYGPSRVSRTPKIDRIEGEREPPPGENSLHAQSPSERVPRAEQQDGHHCRLHLRPRTARRRWGGAEQCRVPEVVFRSGTRT